VASAHLKKRLTDSVSIMSWLTTLTTMCGADLKRHGQGIIENSLRIRKLTPLETWRLMGFDDEDFHKAEKVNSSTQLYKQAGNSIVVDVLEYILKQIFKAI
jgi:site-specific DNA-cytosine methylase